MILVGTEKISILWATKKGSTTLNRIVEYYENISKFDWSNDYDGTVLIPCRRFEDILITSYCEFLKKRRDENHREFIEHMRVNKISIDEDFRYKWKNHIEKFLELDLSDEWLTEFDFFTQTHDITKEKDKNMGGNNASSFYLSITHPKFKFFDLNDFRKIREYAYQIDKTWTEDMDSLFRTKYNNTQLLQENISKLKKAYQKHYIDRQLFHPTSINNFLIHVPRYNYKLLFHMYRSEQFFYNILKEKFLFKGV
jgi:hypothetical protein